MNKRPARALVVVVLLASAAAAEMPEPATLADLRRACVEQPAAYVASADAWLAGERARADPAWRRDILQRLAAAGVLLAREAPVERAARGLEALAATDPIARAYASFSRASFWAESGRFEEALAAATTAATALLATGDPELRAIAELELCDVAARSARHDVAEPHCAEARRLWAPRGDSFQVARIDNFLGLAARERGRTDQAIDHALRARDGFAAAGFPSLARMVEDNLAALYIDRGDGAKALALAERALGHELATGKAQHAVISRLHVAQALSLLGRHAEARAAIEAVIAEAGKLGYDTVLPEAHRARLEIAVASGDPARTRAAAAALIATLERTVGQMRADAVAEMQARYRALEQQREIDRLAQENRVQRLNLALVAVAGTGLLAVAILLVLLLRAGRRREAELLTLSRTDSLTATATRRAFFEDVARAFARWPSPSALLVIDADHFKRLNDSHGHLAGDRALLSLVARIRGQIRASDRLGRLGGEEFGLVLPDVTREEAAQRAEAIRRVVAETPHDVGEAKVALTVSLGAAMLDRPRHASVEQWLAAADAAVYAAKEAGRDRALFADPAL
ncbi:MAG: GGDEF domain-containing protein [Vicinamibacteria bacterium]|nr:GGDEF domain-containing protein [Vicinamibacteria bacterium]